MLLIYDMCWFHLFIVYQPVTQNVCSKLMHFRCSLEVTEACREITVQLNEVQAFSYYMTHFHHLVQRMFNAVRFVSCKSTATPLCPQLFVDKDKSVQFYTFSLEVLQFCH